MSRVTFLSLSSLLDASPGENFVHAERGVWVAWHGDRTSGALGWLKATEQTDTHVAWTSLGLYKRQVLWDGVFWVPETLANVLPVSGQALGSETAPFWTQAEVHAPLRDAWNVCAPAMDANEGVVWVLDERGATGRLTFDGSTWVLAAESTFARKDPTEQYAPLAKVLMREAIEAGVVVVHEGQWVLKAPLRVVSPALASALLLRSGARVQVWKRCSSD